MMKHSGLEGNWYPVTSGTGGPVSGYRFTPQEICSKKKPTIMHLGAFGFKVFCPIKVGWGCGVGDYGI